MINKMVDFDLDTIKKLYEEAFQVFDERKVPPTIEISFYPYININHTIRIRKGRVLIRIADIIQTAPLEIQRALAYILVAKLLNKKVPEEARNIYRKFVNSEELQNIAFRNKQTRGKKILTSSVGEFFNLDGIFEKLNWVYFENKIPETILSWSKRNTYRRLGHYDSVHNTIIISKSLDDDSIPKFVVEYIVYHEMLHIKHPARFANGRRYVHTPKFKNDEEKFSYFCEAEDWLEKNARYLKRKAKK